MKLGVRIGLGSGHTVLDGNPAPPPPNGHNPQYSAHICCRKMAGWIKMPFGREMMMMMMMMMDYINVRPKADE